MILKTEIHAVGAQFIARFDLFAMRNRPMNRAPTNEFHLCV